MTNYREVEMALIFARITMRGGRLRRFAELNAPDCVIANERQLMKKQLDALMYLSTCTDAAIAEMEAAEAAEAAEEAEEAEA